MIVHVSESLDHNSHRDIVTSDDVGNELPLIEGWELHTRKVKVSQREVEDRKVRRLENLVDVMWEEWFNMVDGPAKDQKYRDIVEVQMELKFLVSW